jgi:hypothetical protein
VKNLNPSSNCEKFMSRVSTRWKELRLSQRRNYAISLLITARTLVYLWNEEEQESLGEMAEDCHHSERHTREVAEGVTGKDLKQPSGIATIIAQVLWQWEL